MTNLQSIESDRRGFVDETSAFPAPDSRWSAILSITLVDGRLADVKPLTYVYSMPRPHEAYRFRPNDLEGHLPELLCRLKNHANAWVKANRGRYESALRTG